jgi:guanylate cyclase
MHPEPLSRFVDAIYSISSEPGDTPEYKTWKITFVTANLFGAMAMIVWVLVYLSLSEVAVAIILGIYSVVIWFEILLLRTRRIKFTLAVNIVLVANLAAGFLTTLAIGGISNSGGLFFYVMLSPFAVVTLSSRRFIGWFVASICLVILMAALQPWLRSSNNIPLSYSTIFWVLNFLLTFGIVFITLIALLKQLNTTMRLLHQEQHKSEKLLLNILPRDVAEVLKNETRLIADYIEHASILFADIVSFTPMSQSMSPAELITLLDEVFSQIDTMVDRYKLEKIKTIGDCYMVASGVPRMRPDHAQVLARLALDIQNNAQQNKIAGQQLQFRIGINSGPLVAGVIGSRKFSYDLWGDAVNTASRMESQGSAGMIQITQSTYELIKDDFICESLGQVNIKGKGEMLVWRLIGARSD